MSIKRHAGLTFSGNKVLLAIPYRIEAPSNHQPPDCTIFLHIPKCGGTTLHFIMMCCAKFSQKNYSRCLTKDFSPPIFINYGWTGAWDEAVRVLNDADYPPHYLSGHFPFGIHERINSHCNYITLLRDPVKREISSFNHHYQKGFHSGDSSLLLKMVKERAILDNPQVRMLAGNNYMRGNCSEETYQQAINNLKSYFSIVGTVESSNEFIQALLALNGWPAIAYARTQVSAIRAVNSLNRTLTEMLYEYHAYDKRIHEYAVNQWEAWKAAHVKGNGPLNPDDLVIYLPPNIHENKRPALVGASQLRIY